MFIKFFLAGFMALLLTGWACRGLYYEGTYSSSPTPLASAPQRELLKERTKPRDTSLSVVAGKRIGGIYLGDTLETIDKEFARQSKPVSLNFENCISTTGNWFLPEIGEPVQITFGGDNRVRQIKTYAVHIATPQDIGADDESTIVKQKYTGAGKLDAYMSFYMRATNDPSIEGWPMYWVDQSNGIAFEFVRVKPDATWRVNSITIFDPSDAFRSSYCDGDSPYWKQLTSINPSLGEVKQLEMHADDK